MSKSRVYSRNFVLVSNLRLLLPAGLLLSLAASTVLFVLVERPFSLSGVRVPAARAGGGCPTGRQPWSPRARIDCAGFEPRDRLETIATFV